MKFKIGDDVEFSDEKNPKRLGSATHGRITDINSDGVNVICTVVCHFGRRRGKRDDRTYYVNANRMTIRERPSARVETRSIYDTTTTSTSTSNYGWIDWRGVVRGG